MTNDKISTGSFDLNAWLSGGYEKSIITMIAGSPGSGKSNLAILASCSQAKKGNKVIFVDTEGGFSSDRVKQIIGDDYKEVLKNIFLLEPSSFDEQKQVFQKLLATIKKEHVSLIVVDSMAMLYRLELGDANTSKDDEKVRSVNREISKQMRIFSEISRKQNIPIIITNQVYSGFLSDEEFRKGVQRETNIVGGDLFKYWSKCIIELKNENSRRKAILLKHRSLPVKEMSFEIKDAGIFKKGWI
ncbi:MAG: DNA repair and recombination protein RadB [Nanoarchaeota archaeon]